MAARSFPVSTSHNLIWPGSNCSCLKFPPLAEARVLPSGAKPTHVMEFGCPERVARLVPVATSQRITELGVISMTPPPAPVARVFPSGEKARDQGNKGCG